MIKNVRHIGIVVADLKKSLAFYCELLGFTVANQREESGDYLEKVLACPGTRVTTVKLNAPGGVMIELLEFHFPRPEKNSAGLFHVGPTHFAVTVDNVDLEYERLHKAGVVFNSPPLRSPEGKAKVAFCRAPEGTFVELVEVL